jgi:hypothetical protein
MRFNRRLFAALLLLPGALLAQDDRCSFEPVTSRGNNIQTVGDAVYVGGRTSYKCPRGVSFVADSAVSAFGVRTLIGNVVYTDSLKEIRTDRSLQYQERIGIVAVEGNATMIDRKTGSVLLAPEGLVYTRENETRPSKLEVFRGRPYLTLVDSARNGAPQDTMHVRSDQMVITGQDQFTGRGTVEIRRGQLNATGAQTVFNDSTGIMQLWGIARIIGENYDVRGDSIYTELEGDEFRTVRVFRNARIVSEDLNVTGVRLNIAFDSGAVQRLIAVGQKRDSTNTSIIAVQAEAVAPEFTLKADSIDAVAPKQKLELVTAVGDAYGVRAPDSLDLKLPEMIRSDWLRGDTVIAHFTEASDSAKARRPKSDTASDRVLERLIAIGREAKPATATYRMRAAGDTTNNLEVGYIAARRITAVFKDGAVHDVDAEGQIQGLYLQPIRRTAGALEEPRSTPPARQKPR